MKKSASNPVLSWAAAWLAAVMLIVPATPRANCGCTASEPTGDHGAQQSTENEKHSGQRTCCSAHARRACCKRVRQERPGCCSRSATDGSQLPSGCRCGPGCTCCSRKPSEPHPAAPVPSERNSGDQSGAVASSPAVSTVIVEESPSHAGGARFEPRATPTALERCITLSRFRL
jgi:hypothetical protein